MRGPLCFCRFGEHACVAVDGVLFLLPRLLPSLGMSLKRAGFDFCLWDIARHSACILSIPLCVVVCMKGLVSLLSVVVLFLYPALVVFIWLVGTVSFQLFVCKYITPVPAMIDNIRWENLF